MCTNHDHFLFQLLAARQAAATTCLDPEEQVFIQGLTPALMSDEETDPDDALTWRVSQPEWRSAQLNGILKKCQEAVGQQQQASKSKRCRRVLSGVWSKRDRPRGVKAFLSDI